MLIFQRKIEARIRKLLFKRRMIIILGPRQSGKTTLSKKIISSFGARAAYFDCQLADVREHFVVGKPEALKFLVGDKQLVCFDEAQTIQDIGSILKLFHDTYPEVQVIATGSSSFDLANKINEPMTGRFFEFSLFPLSVDEVKSTRSVSKNDLLEFMQYGMYPAVVGAKTAVEKRELLKNIATTYLYKDIFVFEAIRNPRVFENLVKMLAYQIGQLVTINELSDSLGVSRSVVQRYLRLLEQAYIIKVVHSFSSNQRNELKKSFKAFFIDTGVRNALVDINTDLAKRPDKGSIWENFFLCERLKKGSLETFPPDIMFWRTKQGLEVDIIEKNGPNIQAFECKWKQEQVSFSKFLKIYPSAKTSVVVVEDMLG